MRRTGLFPRVLPKLAAFIPCLLLVSHASAAELFVSADGNDADPGTKSKPFRSFERARDEARKLKTNGPPPAGGITIWLRGGDYFRTNSLELAGADSGTPGAPVVWRSWEGETARFLGGRTISSWAPVKDGQVLRRLNTNARSFVVQADLRALGIKEFGAMKSRGFGRATTPAHCELFFGGKPMTLARWPNEGAWELIDSFPESKAENDGHGGKIGKLEEGFVYRGDRPGRWQDKSDVWVHGYWSWDWANSYEQVASIDLDQRLLKTKAPYGLYGFRKGQRYYFLNILEELDQPGEWFLDRATGLLYFWPPEPIVQSPADPGKPANEIVLSLLDQPLVLLDGVSNCHSPGPDL